MKNKILSFYSYKGGSGRSQMVANLAAYLSIYENKKILIIDWDLEAPGIDFFFHFERKRIKRGLIEVFDDYIEMVKSQKKITLDDLPVFDESCIYNLIQAKKGGVIDFVPSANYNSEKYSHKINLFDWFEFYDNLDGKYYIEHLKNKLNHSKYDFIFIDSRTGLSDYLGICNIQLPYANIFVISPSKQSIEGSYEIANKIINHPYTKENRNFPLLLPVFSRVEIQNGEKYNEWSDFFITKFEKIINNTIKYTNGIINGTRDYIRNATIHYDVDLAYGETIKFKSFGAIAPGSIEEKYTYVWKYVLGTLPKFDIHTIPHLLTPLPFVPEIFHGREKDLHYIHDYLFSSNSNLLLLVNGEGGVGKTSIASKYLHTYSHEYKHVAWIYSERSIATTLLHLATSLGLQFDERANTLERLQVLISAMFELPKPSLLIIDNANELAELRQYLPLLQRCSNFHLLFTTRISDFPQVAFYKIAPLPPDLALQVFKSHYPAFEREEEALFYDIYEAVQGNTLVLELLAKNLRNFNNKLKKNYFLADLRSELEQGLLKLSKSSTLDIGYQAKGQGLRSEKMEVIILAMYDLGELNEMERQLLSVFAVLPAENIPFEHLETLLPEQEELDTTLLALAQKGWLEHNKEVAEFKCSPVVQQVVSLKQKELLLEHCHTLILALCVQLDEEHRHLDNYLHSSVFTRYGENTLAILSVVDDGLGTLCQNIGNFYIDTGDLLKALVVYKHMEKIQAGLLEENPNDPKFKNGLAISYSKLGETHRALGNLNQALIFFKQRNQLSEELYAAYPQNVSFKNGLAISYSKLGEIYRALGNLNEALIFFKQRNQLSEELYAAYPQNVSFKNGLAISYEKLGDTHSALGNLNQALTFFEDQTKLFEELYVACPQIVEFKNGLAISYSKLGDTHSALGNLNQALTFFETETKLFEELYAAYPQNVSFKNGLAISYEKLGDAHSALGNLNQALTFFEQRNHLSEELYAAYPQNVSFKNGLAISYEKLGQTHRDLGNLNQALTFFEDQTKLFEELYAAYPQNVSFKNGLAISYEKLGQTHSGLGNLDQSLTFFEQRNHLSRELYAAYPQNVSFKNGLAVSYQWLGWFLGQKMDSLERAQECYQASKILLEELVGSFPDYVEFKQNLDWVKGKLGD